MKKFYEKPIAELIDFEVENRIMDIVNPSQGSEDAGDEPEL